MKKLLIISTLFISLFSCTGAKKIFQKNSSTKETTTEKTDSISKVETSLPIQDRIVVNIPETDNSEINMMFTELLRRLNTSKTSGSNSYNLKFDEETKQLIADIKVAASKVSETKTNSQTEKSFEQKTDEYISKKISQIPFLVWLGLIFWFLPQILSRLQLIISPISGFIKRNAT